MRVLIGVALGIAALGAALAVGLGWLFPETWSCPQPVGYLVAGIDVTETRRIALMTTAVALLVLIAALARRAWRRKKDGAFVALLFAFLAGLAALVPLYLASMVVLRPWVYTAVEGDTGGRELVVREWSVLLGGGGEVLERDGLLLQRIGVTSSDDGYAPFADGAYDVTRDGDLVTLTWDFEPGRPVSMTLPAAGDTVDRADGCASRDVLY